jgi:hypothetical protein
MITQCRDIISEAVECKLYTTEPLVWWDNLKYKIKKFSQIFSENLAKEKRKEFYYIQNKIQRLCAICCNTSLDNLFHEKIRFVLFRHLHTSYTLHLFIISYISK